MSFNWNVYKVFKNGKRAKVPLHHFMFKGNRENATKHFNSIEIKNLVEKFGKKSSKLNYRIINAGDNQAIPEQTGEEKFLAQQIRVLAKLIREKSLSTKRNYVGGMIYSKKSHWKWQWAALEAATNNYIEGLSQEFETHKEAEDWMLKQIAALSNGK
jgi:hypothetical protein